MTSAAARQQGFTLLEIVVALAVMAAVFVGLFGVYRTTVRSAEQVQRVNRLELAGRLIAEQVSVDLDSMAAAAFLEERQTNQAYAFRTGGDMDSAIDGEVLMEMATAGTLDFDYDFPGYRLSRVQYALVSGRDGPSGAAGDEPRILLRRSRPGAGLETGFILDDREWETMELGDAVTAFTVTALDESGQETSEWDGLEEQAAPPFGIRVEFTVAEGDLAREFTVLRMTERRAQP